MSRHIERFPPSARRLHLVLMTSFLVLSATGLPLLFSGAGWASVMARLFGGFETAGLIHRVFGLVLLGALIWHVGSVLWRALIRRERGVLWGPDSMVVQPRDFVDVWKQIRWMAVGGPPPAFERFTYWEKFDYWAVLWGTALMGAAGLMLWFPEFFATFMPGWMFNVALFVHGAEALLAIGFIFVVHFFNGHLRPGKFPMDTVIFTGSVDEGELRHERAAQHARLVASGEIDRMAVAPPGPDQLRTARLVGGAGLTAGLLLVALIVYAVLG